MTGEFYVTAKWKWFYGFFAIISAVGLFLSLYWITSIRGLPTFRDYLQFLWVFLFFYHVINNCYACFQVIRTNPNGIYFRAFGYNVDAEWKDIKRIERRGVFECLIINKRKRTVNIWFPGIFLGESEVIIPVSQFDKKWRDSELGQQIKQYVPHLFQQSR